jgi:hypothetical protein
LKGAFAKYEKDGKLKSEGGLLSKLRTLLKNKKLGHETAKRMAQEFKYI